MICYDRGNNCSDCCRPAGLRGGQAAAAQVSWWRRYLRSPGEKKEEVRRGHRRGLWLPSVQYNFYNVGKIRQAIFFSNQFLKFKLHLFQI